MIPLWDFVFTIHAHWKRGAIYSPSNLIVPSCRHEQIILMDIQFKKKKKTNTILFNIIMAIGAVSVHLD